MIKAVIFDFDGLILDTETHEYKALSEIYQEHGAELPLSVWGKVIGTISDFNPYTHLKNQADVSLSEKEFNRRLKERFHERLKEEKVRPGVDEYIKAAKQLGLKVGLASSSNYEWVSTHLKNHQLLDQFECISTSDIVEKVKPDPALYLKTAECLGVKPEECLAFEDSANGSLAAKRAGMYCVIVPNEVTKDLDFGKIDYRLESMAEMELTKLIEKIRTKTTS